MPRNNYPARWYQDCSDSPQHSLQTSQTQQSDLSRLCEPQSIASNITDNREWKLVTTSSTMFSISSSLKFKSSINTLMVTRLGHSLVILSIVLGNNIIQSVNNCNITHFLCGSQHFTSTSSKSLSAWQSKQIEYQNYFEILKTSTPPLDKDISCEKLLRGSTWPK